jgi:hypothetical protein
MEHGESDKHILLRQRIDRFYALAMPNQQLVKDILMSLGIHEIVDLEMSLNKYQKNERDAAMRMLERYLPELTSGIYSRWEKAKHELTEIYYPVYSPDEEALL